MYMLWVDDKVLGMLVGMHGDHMLQVVDWSRDICRDDVTGCEVARCVELEVRRECRHTCGHCMPGERVFHN